MSFDTDQCLGRIKVTNISEDQQVPQTINTSQPAVEDLEENDDGFCVRKMNGATTMNNDSIGDADCTNVSPAAASIYPVGLENSVDVQSAPGVASCDQSIEDNKKYPIRECNDSGECLSEIVDSLERSEQLEASIVRDEKDNAPPPNVVHSECSMEQAESSQIIITYSNNLSLQVDEKSCVLTHTGAGFGDENPANFDSVDNSEGNKYLKYNTPTTSSQEPPVQGQTKINNDGPDELVDVRVCDICGDVGREALLALCSKCSDGAEHIYCMRFKMDKVPEGDWVCEDCIMVQEPKRQKQTEEEKFNSASNLSHLKEGRKGSSATKAGIKRCFSDMEMSSASKRRVIEGDVRPLSSSRGNASLPRALSLKIMDKGDEAPRQIHSNGHQVLSKVMEQAPSTSGYRLLNSTQKSGTLRRSVKPLKSFGSARKTLLTQVSSLKIINKSRGTISTSSSLDNQSAKKVRDQVHMSPGSKSAKSQQQFHEGNEDLCKSKVLKHSNSTIHVQQLPADAKSERISTNDHDMTSIHPKRKLSKSISFSGVRTGLNTSYSPKGVRNPAVEKAEKIDSVNRSNKLSMPVADSGAMRLSNSWTTSSSDVVKASCSSKSNIEKSGVKANTSKTSWNPEIFKEPCSSRYKVENMKAVQLNVNSNVNTNGALAHGGQKSANTFVAKSVEENRRPSDSSHDIIPSKNTSSDPEWKASQSTPQKVDLGCPFGVGNGVKAASDKVTSASSLPINDLRSGLAPPRISAVPESECVWKGAFELEKSGELPMSCCGIQAYLSTCASSNALELVHKFQPKILVKEVARLDIWPSQFQANHPTEQDIAVYFFAEDLQSFSTSYKGLLDDMIKNDLALEANFGEFQFLVFPSSLLPARSQRWNALLFLWGVFRVRTVDNCSLQNPSLVDVALKQGIESVDPMALPCSALTKDNSGENEVSSTKKCLTSDERLLCEPDTMVIIDEPTENKSYSASVLCSDYFQKEDGHTNQAIGILGKSRVISSDGSENKNLVSLEKTPFLNRACGNDSIPKLWPEKLLDVPSWSSISVDSGPSGSSDGGGCAKSDEGQVEQLHNLSNCKALNLELRLGSGLEPEEHVDLDLVLGFSGTSKYDHNHCPKEISCENADALLVLSLGMPYSVG